MHEIFTYIRENTCFRATRTPRLSNPSPSPGFGWLRLGGGSQAQIKFRKGNPGRQTSIWGKMGDRRKEPPRPQQEGLGRVTRKKEKLEGTKGGGGEDRRLGEPRRAGKAGSEGSGVAAPTAQWPARPPPRAPRAPLTSWCRRRRGFPSSRETREAPSPGVRPPGAGTQLGDRRQVPGGS